MCACTAGLDIAGTHDELAVVLKAALAVADHDNDAGCVQVVAVVRHCPTGGARLIARSLSRTASEFGSSWRLSPTHCSWNQHVQLAVMFNYQA